MQAVIIFICKNLYTMWHTSLYLNASQIQATCNIYAFSMPRDTCSKQLGFTASGPKRTSFTFTCMRQILHFLFTLWFSNIAKGGNPLLDNNQKVVKLNKHLEVGRIKTRFKIIYSWQLFKFYKILLAPQQRAFRLISTKDENKLQWAPKLLRHCTQIG